MNTEIDKTVKPISHFRFIIPLFFIALMHISLSAQPVLAISDSVTQKMIDSVVLVRSEWKVKGTNIGGGGHGSGFLLADSEYVVTNEHVISSCIPKEENKKSVLFNFFYNYKKKHCKQNPKTALEDCPPEILKILKNKKTSNDRWNEVFEYWLRKWAGAKTENSLPDLEQSLFILTMDKNNKTRVKISVAKIVYESSRFSDKDANMIGTDVAILQLEKKLDYKQSIDKFATGSAVKVNDSVIVSGFPYASIKIKSRDIIPTLKSGTVSKLGGESYRVTKEAQKLGLRGIPVIETEAPIVGGNSGGPMFNNHGEVIGINTFSHTEHDGYGWAQDISVLIPILKKIGLPVPQVREKQFTWIETHLLWVKVGASIVIVMALLVGVIAWRKKIPVNKIGGGSRKRPAVPMSVIVGIMGEFNGKTISIPENGLMLGRVDPEEGVLGFSDLDLTISRVHCRIRYSLSLQQFEVVDLNSKDGTFLNSESDRLAPHRKYNGPAGTIIRIGQYNQFNLGRIE